MKKIPQLELNVIMDKQIYVSVWYKDFRPSISEETFNKAIYIDGQTVQKYKWSADRKHQAITKDGIISQWSCID